MSNPPAIKSTTRSKVYVPGPQYIADTHGRVHEVDVRAGLFTKHASKALAAHQGDSLYKMGGEVRTLVREDDRLVARPLHKDRLRVLIDESCSLTTTKMANTKQGPTLKERFLSATRDHADLVMASLPFSGALRPLKTIRSYPCFLPGWSLSRKGYNTGGFLYDEPLDLEPLTAKDFEPVPEEECRRWLYDLVTDFPFATVADRTAFIALLLTLLCKPAIDGNTPLFLVQASRPRTGKSRLVNEVLGPSIFGHAPHSNTLPKRQEEIDKTLFSILASGQPYVFIDNVPMNVALGGDFICSALTTGSVAGRLLGTSNNTRIENNAVWIATANNCTLGPDMPGRTVEINLQPLDDAPEKRTSFKHPDIKAYSLKHRAKTLMVLRSMVERWRDTGAPEFTDKTIGGFERWTRAIGGILAVNGFEGFLDGWAIEREELDDQLAETMELIWKMRADMLTREHKIGDKDPYLYWRASDDRVSMPLKDELDKLLAKSEAFAHVFERRSLEDQPTATRTALGRALVKIESRPVKTSFGPLKFVKTSRRPARWSVVKHEPPTLPSVEDKE